MSIIRLPKMSDHDKMGLIEKSLDLLPLISEWLKDQKEALVENGPSPLPPQSAMIAESVEITHLRDKLVDAERTIAFLNNQVSKLSNDNVRLCSEKFQDQQKPQNESLNV